MPEPAISVAPSDTVTRSVRATATLVVLLLASAAAAAAQDAQGLLPVEQLVEWLDHPETQWLATARLQQVPQAALPLLLQPGRVSAGAHNQWTAPMLALAKLGDPAMPAIVDRLLT